MLLELLKWDLKNTAHVITRTLLRIFSPILKSLFHVTLLVMVLTWPAIHFSVKVASILVIYKINCLVLPMDVEMVGSHRRTRE